MVWRILDAQEIKGLRNCEGVEKCLARLLAGFVILSTSGSVKSEDMLTESQKETYAPLIDRGLDVRGFTLLFGGDQVNSVIVSPPEEELATDPVLLFAVGGPEIHFLSPHQKQAEYFWEQGHRAVSFPDSSVGHSLELFRDRIVEGTDPTVAFIERAKGVLDYCVDQNWVKPDRIVVTGISRFGYYAFRLMAEDDRLNIGGGFSPVTDWRDLSEFREQRDQEVVEDLRLSLWAEKLTGKKIYMAIGNHDDRVSTMSCAQFFLDLNAASRKRGFDGSLADFFVTPDIDHGLGEGLKFCWTRRWTRPGNANSHYNPRELAGSDKGLDARFN
jgi:hypothetical protein